MLFEKLIVKHAMSWIQTASATDIDKSMDDLTLMNTKKNKNVSMKTIWGVFRLKKLLVRKRNFGGIAFILKDWASNIRKKDGSVSEESVVRTVWIATATFFQKKYYKDFTIAIDLFDDFNLLGVYEMLRSKYKKWIRKKEEKAHRVSLTKKCSTSWSFSMKTSLRVCKKKIFFLERYPSQF